MDYINNDTNNNLFQRAGEYFKVSKDKIMHVYKTLGIEKDKKGKYKSNFERINYLQKNGILATQSKIDNVLILNKLARCIYQDGILVDDVLNYLDDTDNIISSASAKFNISEEKIMDIYDSYGIVQNLKSTKDEYHTCCSINKLLGRDLISFAAKELELPIEIVYQVACRGNIDWYFENCNANTAIGNILDDIGNPNNTIDSVTNKYNISKKILCDVYQQFGITKDNTGKYCGNSDIYEALLKSGCIKNTKLKIPIEKLNEVA